MDADQDRSDQRVRTVCQLLLAVIGLGVALALLRPVLVPFCLALLLTYCLTPVIDLQVKYLKVPRSAALVGVGIAGVLLALLLGYLTVGSVVQIADHFEEYRAQIGELTEHLAQALPLERLGIESQQERVRAVALTNEAGRQILAALLGGLTDVVSTGALVVVFMIFLLLGRQGPPYDPTSLLGEIEGRVRRYVVRVVGLSALTGLLVGVLLAVLGVPFALVFGFLTFLLNFIPNVGSMIATVLPVPVVLLSPGLSPATQVLAVAGPGLIQFLIGSLIQPRFYGAALDLHPVTVLLALIFFGMAWGVIGAFLAMPITGVIRIVLGRFHATRPVAALMTGDLEALTRPGPASDAARRADAGGLPS
jgi:AI-2 transport protein TqsA